MAMGRFIHIMAVTAIASGAAAAASFARAEGGGGDRALLLWNGPSSQQSQAAIGEATRAVAPVPLPPRRPLLPEPSGPSAVTAIQAEAAPQSEAAPQPEAAPRTGTTAATALPLQQPFNGAMLTLPQQHAAVQPLVSAPPPAADRFRGAAIETPAAPKKTADPAPAISEAVPETAKTVTMPLPPQRPARLEEVEAKVELASLQQPGQPQKPEPPAVSAPVAESTPDNNPPGFFERLFTAPPGRVGESIQNEPPRPRAMSRLNRVIGDDPVGASQLRALISKHAAANGLPYKFADAVVRVESRYNPRARNGPYIGLMQIHPRTAASLGYGGDIAGLFDPDVNLQYGIKYLAMAYRLAGGDTCGTVMRYQGGHRAVSMTSANRVYCNKVKMIFSENH